MVWVLWVPLFAFALACRMAARRLGMRKRRERASALLARRRRGATRELLLGPGIGTLRAILTGTAPGCPTGGPVVSLVARGSDSGLVTRAAFKAVRLPADAGSGRFDSYPLPPTAVAASRLAS